MPTISRPDPALPPKVRARTILAGCARVDVADLDRAAAPTRATALLEWAGSPFLAAPAGAELPGRVRLTCRAGVGELGVLRLTGSCEDPQPLDGLPALARLVRGALDPAQLVAAQVVLDGVRLLTPATGDGRARSVPVPLDDWFAAAPDVWTLHGRRAADHLESRHQDELRLLAVDSLDGAPVAAVLVRAISAHGLELGCLLPAGVSTVRLAFTDPVATPAELAGWLTARLRRITGHPRD